MSSQKIKDVLGFETSLTIRDAVKDLKLAFEKNFYPIPYLMKNILT